MAIRGSLKEASLPDVLQLLAMGRKTGCLSVANSGAFGSVFFDRGRIAHAAIVNRRDRLGEVMVKAGLITAEQLESALATQRAARGPRLGELLVAQGAATQAAVDDQIRVQTEEAVYHLFTWAEGTFNFEADVRPEEGELLVSINPESLLLEGARRVDEWALIEKKIPSFDLVFELDRARMAASPAPLVGEQELVARLLDGQRDVAALVDETGLVEFEVAKALFALVSAGLARSVGRSRPAEPVVSATRVEEHRNLGLAFYKTGMLDEALREFRRVGELRAGDQGAAFYTGLVHLRAGRLDEAVRAFAAVAGSGAPGYAAHHNLAYALERQGRWDDARTALDAAVARGGGNDPRVLTSLGIARLRAGDAPGAREALERARPLFGRRPPTAAWFHYAATAAAMQGDLAGAAAVAAEGLAAHPHAAPLHNAAALVHERRGEYAEAAAAVERGAHADPALPQLHKNAGDYHYRAGRYDEALDAYQRAVKAAPSLGADVFFKLGNIRYRRHDAAEAVRQWERALALDPEHAIVRTNLAAVRPRV